MSGAEGPEGLSQCQPAFPGLQYLWDCIDAIPACSLADWPESSLPALGVAVTTQDSFTSNLVGDAAVAPTSQLHVLCMHLLNMHNSRNGLTAVLRECIVLL